MGSSLRSEPQEPLRHLWSVKKCHPIWPPTKSWRQLWDKEVTPAWPSGSQITQNGTAVIRILTLPLVSALARLLTNLCEPQLFTWKMDKIIINLMKWLCNGLCEGLISLSKWGWNAGEGKKQIYRKVNGAVLFSQMYTIQFKADHSSGSMGPLAIVISQGYWSVRTWLAQNMTITWCSEKY